MNAMNDINGEIYAAPRCRCLKCGEPLSTPSATNNGIASWCKTCQWLLRDPSSPTLERYHGNSPGPVALKALGLTPSFQQRSFDEAIPEVADVELWPEPPAPPLLEMIDRLLAAS